MIKAIIKKKSSLFLFIIFIFFNACYNKGDKAGTAENKETLNEQNYKNADADTAQNDEVLKDIDDENNE